MHIASIAMHVYGLYDYIHLLCLWQCMYMLFMAMCVHSVYGLYVYGVDSYVCIWFLQTFMYMMSTAMYVYSVYHSIHLLCPWQCMHMVSMAIYICAWCLWLYMYMMSMAIYVHAVHAFCFHAILSKHISTFDCDVYYVIC